MEYRTVNIKVVAEPLYEHSEFMACRKSLGGTPMNFGEPAVLWLS